MASYLYQVGYTPEAWATLIRNPQDRIQAVRPAIEGLGGKLVNAWGSFGEYDIVVVAEMPDNVSAAALGVALAGGGALRSCKTTPLLSSEEIITVLRRAGQSSYRPPA